MAAINRQLTVKDWPEGLPEDRHFELVEGAMPEIGDGQLLIRNLYLSIDPYYRHSLGPRFVGTPFCHPGDVMMGVTLGQVVDSRDPDIAPGRFVTTLHGKMQDYAAVPAKSARLLPDALFGTAPGKLPLSTALGVAGIPGLTAWVAVMVLGQPAIGETFLVSSASGCVGATAGQLAMHRGAIAIGIAGAREKCDWTEREAGFAHCVSYKSDRFAEELEAATPDGVDVNMEHVGGDVLTAVLGRMNYQGRVVMSGMIDQYNKSTAPPGHNWGIMVSKVLTVMGLRVFDHFHLMPAYEEAIFRLIQDRGLVWKEDMTEGLEGAPGSLNRVLTGANFGKSTVHIADPA